MKTLTGRWPASVRLEEYTAALRCRKCANVQMQTSQFSSLTSRFFGTPSMIFSAQIGCYLHTS
ncbi:MAG: hypothetical protein ACJAV1_001795 [Paraglaciecola sp.]|jgi:hypothetical protein